MKTNFSYCLLITTSLFFFTMSLKGTQQSDEKSSDTGTEISTQTDITTQLNPDIDASELFKDNEGNIQPFFINSGDQLAFAIDTSDPENPRIRYLNPRTFFSETPQPEDIIQIPRSDFDDLKEAVVLIVEGTFKGVQGISILTWLGTKFIGTITIETTKLSWKLFTKIVRFVSKSCSSKNTNTPQNKASIPEQHPKIV